MRKFILLAVLLLPLFSLQAPAQPKKLPYVVEFDRTKDIEKLDKSPDGLKKGIFIKVKFAITLDGSKVDKLSDDFKLIIEEDGHKVKEVTLPKPTTSDALSVMLALDTSGSMKEHGRMAQARDAAVAFLSKLPARNDCGLILFDHEIRHKIPMTLEREPLLAKIHTTDPRGGTAYIDAASEAIAMLRATPRGRDRAVVLITDGIDLNSKKTIDKMIAEAKNDKVRVYTIGIGEVGKFEPVHTVMALDHSGSMKPPADNVDTTSKIEAMHIAAERYVDSMSSVGRCSIVPFSSIVGTPRPFLDKTAVVKIDGVVVKIDGVAKNALKETIRKLQPYGETAVFDATYESICVLEADATRGRRAVIAMTDGVDNSSRRRVEEVIERAKETKIPLYMLGFGRDGEIDEVSMRQMADATGGKYYRAKNKESLLEIFENLSIQLHDDGIDEKSLKQIARETGGQYYPAKNVAELKFILETVTQSIQREAYEIVFESKFPSADGTLRNVSLKLVQSGTVVSEVKGSYQVTGLVVAEMSPFIYLFLLIVIGGLIALPTLLRRSPAA